MEEMVETLCTCLLLGVLGVSVAVVFVAGTEEVAAVVVVPGEVS